MGDLFMKLPEGLKFMQQVVSRTSPEDAFKLSCVSKMFHSVADSDVVWDSFIHFPDHLDAIKYKGWDFCRKGIFLILVNNPVYYDEDLWSGKRRLELSTNNLSFTFLDTDYWNPKTRHRLGHVVWLEIKGKVSTSKLSANTTYTAYLRFDISNTFYYGFHVQKINKSVYLDPRIAKSESQYFKRREDTLFEVELGDYFHNDGETRDLEMAVREVKSGKPKCGIEICGMELRPKRESINLYGKSSPQAHSHSERNIKRREEEMSKEREEGCEDTNLFSNLLKGFAQTFMEEVVSRTSPVDACRLSVVAKSFRSAAESDAVWERFLPSDYQQFLCRAGSLPDISIASKKDLYLFLIGNPLIDANTKSFWLDKWNGKKCFMITISITPDSKGSWRRRGPALESRFAEIYESNYVTWFEIYGKISTSMLSPDTTYTAYVVHKWDSGYGYNYPVENPTPFEASVGSSEDESVNQVVYLLRKKGETGSQYPVERKDGWLEVQLGEYFNKGGENKDLEMSVMDVTPEFDKSGFIIQGIEIRPKHG